MSYQPRHKSGRDIAGPLGQALMLAWLAAAATVVGYVAVSLAIAAAAGRLP